jgi:hypothetical protein
LQEARGCSREADESFREMELPRVVPSPLVVPISLDSIGGRNIS